MKGFRPFGLPGCKNGYVTLSFEEYESIRMINYLDMQQEDAAREMGISRPTFTRLYNKALKQIAGSFVEGKTIVFDGGDYNLTDEWYRCRKCYKLIKGIENHTRCDNCNSYNINELIKIN